MCFLLSVAGILPAGLAAYVLLCIVRLQLVKRQGQKLNVLFSLLEWFKGRTDPARVYIKLIILSYLVVSSFAFLIKVFSPVF